MVLQQLQTTTVSALDACVMYQVRVLRTKRTTTQCKGMFHLFNLLDLAKLTDPPGQYHSATDGQKHDQSRVEQV